jgi:hypothetical protein
VAFSGGRDSSALLAVATEVARREGAELPIPVTARFSSIASTDEASWQEAMIRHLGLGDWERVEVNDELDLLGPYAQQLTLEHGNLFPFNAHFSAPLVERARGGSLLTGVGGDEVFGTMAWPRAARLLRPTGPWLSRGAGRVLAGTPMPLRRWTLRQQLDTDRPWMTVEAARHARRRWIDWNASQPVNRDRALRDWLWPSRYWQLARRSLTLVGDLWGAPLISPFMEPDFLDAAAARMGPSGFENRASAIESLLGDGVLPASLRHRTSKATFDLVFFNHYSRDFIKRWDRTGLDAGVIGPGRLYQEWQSEPRPDARSYSLLKAAWAAGHTTVG